jgi:hypothetical protein
VLRISDAGQHAHGVLNVRRSLDGELARLRYEAALLAVAFQLNQVCADFVLRRAE